MPHLALYTATDHRLSRKDVMEILKNEYDMTVDRKAIRCSLDNFMQMGYDIEYLETDRMTADPNRMVATEGKYYLICNYYTFSAPGGKRIPLGAISF